MTDVVALRGRGAFFSAPFKNSISRAWRPTIRSNATILVSYSCSRSAAWASASKPPASSSPPKRGSAGARDRAAWRAPKRCPPAMYSCTTWRLKLDAVRTLLSGHGFIFRKPKTPVKSLTSTCPAPGAYSTFRTCRDSPQCRFLRGKRTSRLRVRTSDFDPSRKSATFKHNMARLLIRSRP